MKNPPAFPRPSSEDFNDQIEAQDGMTLRDYFAAAFLKGFAVTYKAPDSPREPEQKRQLAALCYGVADAMLAAREAKS